MLQIESPINIINTLGHNGANSIQGLDEICEAQKTMTDKYGPAPTQSALSNSGAGGSSHAPTHEESSMYMVSVKYYFHHSNICNNILGQWDKRSSPSSKKP